MKDILNYLFTHQPLTKDQAYKVLIDMGKGTYSESEIASFLTVYCMRSITAPELSGFREALIDLAVPVDLSDFNCIDVCGTGGDEKNTFNISTLTAFVLAGAGYKVAKHGNYAVSSASGSSNILEYFGYRFSNDQDKLKREMEQANIAYLHAPLFHPAMKYVAPVRKSLGVKTFFNILGPMVNPARLRNQVVGVFNDEVFDLYRQVYTEAGMNHYILFSLDGYDEISLTGKFRAGSNNGDQVLTASDLGLSGIQPMEIFGGDTVEKAADIFKTILTGHGTGAQNNVVAANAAFAIHCLHPEKELAACVTEAKKALLSGQAESALEKLIELQ